jgi:hypothetical protein
VACPLGQVIARTPAGSIEPGTVARAALALGAAETGRVAPPRPAAELIGAAADPLGLPDTDADPDPAADPLGLPDTAADPAGLTDAEGPAGLTDAEGPEELLADTGRAEPAAVAEPETEARPLVAPLTGAAFTGAALTGAALTGAGA